MSAPVELGGADKTLAAKFRAERDVGQTSPDRFRDFGGIRRIESNGGVRSDLSERRVVRAGADEPACHRLDQRQPESLEERWKNIQRGVLIEFAETIR